jgi:hypothetical protein
MTIGNIKFTQQPPIASGNITDSTIVPAVENFVNYKMTVGNLATYINSAGGNIVPGNISTGNITAGNVSVTGNVTADYFFGNGSQLTGLPATYTNANVAAFLPTYTGNLNANVVTANIVSATGNVIGDYIFGNGSQLTGIVATTVGTLSTLSVTGNAVIGNVSTGIVTGSVVGNVSGNLTGATVSTTGNITANYFFGNGSQLTGVVATGIGTLSSLSVTGNVDAGNLRTAGQVSATGNITANYFIGNGSTLTAVNASNVQGTVANAAYATNAGSATTATTAGSATTATSATTAATVTSASQPTITSVGTLTSLSVSGNIAGGNITSAGTLSTGGNIGTSGNFNGVAVSVTGNVRGGNLITAGYVSATGNVTGAYIFGNGSQLTGIATSTYGNSNVVTLLSGFGSNTISTTGNISSGYNTTTGYNSSKYYIESVYAGGNTSTGVTPAQGNGSVQKFTANANFTLNAPTGMSTGSSITLIFTQDATGNRAMTPNAAYKFANGSKVLSTTANAIDVMSVFYDGTNYLCNLVKGYS